MAVPSGDKQSKTVDTRSELNDHRSMSNNNQLAFHVGGQAYQNCPICMPSRHLQLSVMPTGRDIFPPGLVLMRTDLVPHIARSTRVRPGGSSNLYLRSNINGVTSKDV